MKLTAARINEINAILEAAYAQDCANGKPDVWGVVYEAPLHSAAIAALKSSGEWEGYRAARPDIFAVA